MTPQEIQIIGIETIYTLLIIIPSLIIYYKTNKLYNFSKYRGLKYFSNAFLFLAAGFFIRYFVIINNALTGYQHQTIQTFNTPLILMEFFLILPGMMLLYALVWQNFENKKYTKTPINTPLFFMYATAIILATIDYLMQTLILLYSSQIILFGAATIISYKNYREKKQYFKQFYFISMTLFLIIMLVNFIAQYTINNYPIMRFYAYITTVIALAIFLYITEKLTNNTNNNTANNKSNNKK
ncbi:MAG: hypothetical protein ACLFN8_02055 [Candidatus Woesearchaeota archaeon]